MPHARQRSRLLIAALMGLVLLVPRVALQAASDPGGDGDSEPVNRVTACGVERWAVKTGTDPAAGLVNQRVVVPTNILHLRSLPAPAQPPLKSRVRPVELTVWSVQALLLRYKMEQDSDYHLVLSDTGGRTMIAELPAPQCVGSTSPFLPAIRTVRRAFTAQFHPTKTWHRLRVTVRVQGVGFFDFKHGQSGVAPNAIELHPVLGIQWGNAASAPVPVAPGTPGPLPTTSSGQGGSLVVRVQVHPNPTADGTTTTVTATTTPGAICAVTVRYASGHDARSASLATSQTADSSGQVSWTWRPSTSTPGTATATVQCTRGATTGTGRATFTVQ